MLIVNLNILSHSNKVIGIIQSNKTEISKFGLSKVRGNGDTREHSGRDLKDSLAIERVWSGRL